MIIKSIRVRNFRSVKDENLLCENLTVLVGPNGSGKSSFLRALEIFYSPKARYTEDDFYARETLQNILIIVTFKGLTDEEKKLFQKYIEGEELTVEKELKQPSNGSQKYYGTSLQNSEFQNFRVASGPALREEYNKLRGIDKYSNFPSYTNKSNAESTLSDWEQSHPDQCNRQRDDGQFFGFKEVGAAHLERYTKFLFIPAVRDATEDATEGKKSVISEIMDLVVRSELAKREEIKDFKEKTQKRYEEVFEPSKLQELQNLENNLSNTLGIYVPGSRVSLSWHEATGFDIPMPVADIRLVEDDYPTPVGHTGHGLQRAFILTMLQHLALVESPTEVDSENKVARGMPNLIIGIEEPELYQHPNRQRHLSKVLMKLAKESIHDLVKQIQIIYSTHSPLLVNLENFEQIRLFRKEKKEKDKTKQTKIFYTNFSEVAKIIEKANNAPEGTYTGETLRPRLKTIMTPWINEGFFANLVVLVEGEEDRAAIIGTAIAMEIDFESKGISVIPCMGKTCIDRPIAIFRNLQIPVYAIWDSDCRVKNPKPQENHLLLRLFNQKIEDWPDMVTDEFACFKKNLMDTLKEEIGKELCDNLLGEYHKNFGLREKNGAIKNPYVIQYIIQEAKKQGKSSNTLEAIINRIVSKSY